MRSVWLPALTFILFVSSAGKIQSQETTRTPRLQRDQLFTSDLISWTDMQSPDPVPASSSGSNPSQNTSVDKQKTPVQTFAGVIDKEGNTYVLRTSSKWFYDLDDQGLAAQYLNQRVAVVGTLNVSGDLIHVQLIRVASA
jgi:Protein of unknown function (DUF5818)